MAEDRRELAAWLRLLPFVAFMALLALRGMAPADGSWGFDTRWLYAANLVVVGGMLAVWWRDYGELARQNWPDLPETLLAVGVGLGVFVLYRLLLAALVITTVLLGLR